MPPAALAGRPRLGCPGESAERLISWHLRVKQQRQQEIDEKLRLEEENVYRAPLKPASEVNERIDKLLLWGVNKRFDIEVQADMKQDAELTKCSFKPKINKGSLSYLPPATERDSSRQKLPIGMEQCTFKPEINKNIRAQSKVKSMLEGKERLAKDGVLEARIRERIETESERQKRSQSRKNTRENSSSVIPYIPRRSASRDKSVGGIAFIDYRRYNSNGLEESNKRNYSPENLREAISPDSRQQQQERQKPKIVPLFSQLMRNSSKDSRKENNDKAFLSLMEEDDVHNNSEELEVEEVEEEEEHFSQDNCTNRSSSAQDSFTLNNTQSFLNRSITRTTSRWNRAESNEKKKRKRSESTGTGPDCFSRLFNDSKRGNNEKIRIRARIEQEKNVKKKTCTKKEANEFWENQKAFLRRREQNKIKMVDRLWMKEEQERAMSSSRSRSRSRSNSTERRSNSATRTLSYANRFSSPEKQRDFTADVFSFRRVQLGDERNSSRRTMNRDNSLNNGTDELDVSVYTRLYNRSASTANKDVSISPQRIRENSPGQQKLVDSYIHRIKQISKETEGCTFKPEINENSARIVQKMMIEREKLQLSMRNSNVRDVYTRSSSVDKKDRSKQLVFAQQVFHLNDEQENKSEECDNKVPPSLNEENNEEVISTTEEVKISTKPSKPNNPSQDVARSTFHPHFIDTRTEQAQQKTSNSILSQVSSNISIRPTEKIRSTLKSLEILNASKLDSDRFSF